jgi:DNA repair and recombination protein RAD54B
MCDFCNAGVLGDLPFFKRNFASFITASREATATPSEKKAGEARAKQLSEITNRFIIRRTSNILTKYLPPKGYIPHIASITYFHALLLQLSK